MLLARPVNLIIPEPRLHAVLREEGIKVILINSNPATIMTDPMMADKVYLLPLTVESIEQIIEENASGEYRIDAVLANYGRPNCAQSLQRSR